MHIYGGEPPHIEQPEPDHGDVVKEFNKITLMVEQKVVGENTEIADITNRLTTLVSSYIDSVVTPITQHLNARGVTHNETKDTVKLGNKDNYRMATLTEHVNFADVNAFVHPQGAKQSIQANMAGFAIENYQKNDLFRIASFFSPNDFNRASLATIEPPRIFSPDTRPAVVLSGDRIIVSPVSLSDNYETDVMFISSPFTETKKFEFSEVTEIRKRLDKQAGWNAYGSRAGDGALNVFKPIADRGVFEFGNSLATRYGSSILMKEHYGSTIFHGLLRETTINGNNFWTGTRPFYAASLTATNVTFPAFTMDYDYFNGITSTTRNASASSGNSYNPANFITLASGMTIGINTAYEPVLTTFWNMVNKEAYSVLEGVVNIAYLGVVKLFKFKVVESTTIGVIEAGSNGAVVTLGNRVKDTISNTFVLGSNNWFTPFDPTNANDSANSPGVINNLGVLVRANTERYGIRVKRTKTTYNNLQDWVMANNKPVIPSKESIKQFIVPGRYAPFTTMPERIIPISSTPTETLYAIYAPIPAKGTFGVYLNRWDGSAIRGTTVGSKTPFVNPTNSTLMDIELPKGLCVRGSSGSLGFVNYSLVFSEANNYKAPKTFSLTNSGMALGATVTVPEANLIIIKGFGGGLLQRAATRMPNVDPSLREIKITIAAFTANKAIIVMSDGVGYAEACICGYTITNNTFVPNYTSTNGIKFGRITPTNNTVYSNLNRESVSGDGPWSRHTDLMCMQKDTDVYDFVIARPFGDLYGSISFRVENTLTATPVFTAQRMQPANMFKGNAFFDTSEVDLPPILVPNDDLYYHYFQEDSKTPAYRKVGYSANTNLFEDPSKSWCFIPAGSRFILSGRAFVLDEPYSVPVSPTGVNYCYLAVYSGELQTFSSTTKREPSNNEVLVGTTFNGKLTLERSYIVLDNRLISEMRAGSCVPAFTENGANGVNNFFKTQDKID